jgi:hypothetical protein
MKILPVILSYYMHTDRPPEMALMKTDNVITDGDVFTHAHSITDNGVLIVPLHGFEHPSRWQKEN